MKAFKKSITLLISFAFCICASAQDILVKKDGSVLQIKTEEISETAIKYHLWSNQTGPLRSISIENVISINYENGEIEWFDAEGNRPIQDQVGLLSITPPQKEEKPAKPTSVTIPMGTTVPIYSVTTINGKDLGSFKAKEVCLAYVEEDIIIDGIIAIPRNSEVYGAGGNGKGRFSWSTKLDLSLRYILTPNGTLIAVDGILHMKPVVSPAKIHIKETNTICTVKENVVIQSPN